MLFFVLSYRAVGSIFMGGNCRFNPSCSEYALLALNHHSPKAAAALIVKRLAKCHPWGAYGYDPIPSKGVEA